jgi:hypothetical protein
MSGRKAARRLQVVEGRGHERAPGPSKRRMWSMKDVRRVHQKRATKCSNNHGATPVPEHTGVAATLHHARHPLGDDEW